MNFYNRYYVAHDFQSEIEFSNPIPNGGRLDVFIRNDALVAIGLDNLGHLKCEIQYDDRSLNRTFPDAFIWSLNTDRVFVEASLKTREFLLKN